MKMDGEQRITAARDRVWDGLNDPDVLKQCIPGCVELVRTDGNGFEATVQAKVGPVKAKFKGVVTLSNIDAPNSYTITGEGKGGAAGFAKGGANVTLADDGAGGTLLTYAVDAKVGGKLAQIGSRLVDASAKKMAGEFFEKFTDAVGGGENESPQQGQDAPETVMGGEPAVMQAATAEPETAAPAPAKEAEPEPSRSLSPMTWVFGVIALVGIMIFVFSGN